MTLGALGMDQGPKRVRREVTGRSVGRSRWRERRAVGVEGTRARALCRASLSLSRTSLCSWAVLSVSRADTSSFLSLETFSSSSTKRP